MDIQPVQVDQTLDTAMRWLWDHAPEWPKEVRLYGGAACALYFGHRVTRDFDFVHVNWGVTPGFVRDRMGAFGAGEIRGGAGRIDLACETPKGPVPVNYMETDPSMMLPPTQEPVRAANGMLVAHPHDLMAAKLRALSARDCAADYQDVAAALRAAPEAVLAGLGILDEASEDLYRLLRMMSSPGAQAGKECPADDLEAVADFAVEYLLNNYHPAPFRAAAGAEAAAP